MKKVKQFLMAVMEENRLKGEISQIMKRYPDASFEAEVKIEDYNEIIERMEKIIVLRKSINLDARKEEEVILEIREIVRDMQALEGTSINK
ncbi:hypothetical protein ACF3OC_07915 [Sphingobacterium cellulitidis]|uniref:hypothetical protein n=1 Tax=Sphingobacterium cellulitidis TaxID=1768011 RepID=UPI00370D1B18